MTGLIYSYEAKATFKITTMPLSKVKNLTEKKVENTKNVKNFKSYIRPLIEQSLSKIKEESKVNNVNKIFPSIEYAVALSILETGGGTTKLWKEAYNMYGLKFSNTEATLLNASSYLAKDDKYVLPNGKVVHSHVPVKGARKVASEFLSFNNGSKEDAVYKNMLCLVYRINNSPAYKHVRTAAKTNKNFEQKISEAWATNPDHYSIIKKIIKTL